MKWTAGRQVSWRRHIARNRGKAMALGGMPRPPRADQPARIGMRVIAEEILRRALLHEPAAVEDERSLGEVCDDTEIMADDDERHAEFRLQFLEQADDLLERSRRAPRLVHRQ